MCLRVKQTDSRRAIAFSTNVEQLENRGYHPTANWYEKHMRMCLVERREPPCPDLYGFLPSLPPSCVHNRKSEVVICW